MFAQNSLKPASRLNRAIQNPGKRIRRPSTWTQHQKGNPSLRDRKRRVRFKRHIARCQPDELRCATWSFFLRYTRIPVGRVIFSDVVRGGGVMSVTQLLRWQQWPIFVVNEWCFSLSRGGVFFINRSPPKPPFFRKTFQMHIALRYFTR